MTLKNKNLKEHKKALDEAYAKIDFKKKPWGYDSDYTEWTRTAVSEPIVNTLKRGSVLDAGGGYGFFRKFVKYGRTYVNLDISHDILKYDKGDNKMIGTVEALPFKNGTFDNVVSIGVLRHCFSPEEFVNEARRVLKKTGRLLITTPSNDWPKILNKSIWGIFNLFYVIQILFKESLSIFKRLEKNQQSNEPVIYDRLYDMKELIKLVTDRGFAVLKCGRSGKNLPSEIYPPKRVIDNCFNSNKMGQFLYVIAEKKD